MARVARRTARYVLTPARRRALKKAQRASARKRRGKGKGKLAKANRRITRQRRVIRYTAIAAGGAALTYGGYKAKSKSIKRRKKPQVRSATRRAPSRRAITAAPRRVQRPSNQRVKYTTETPRGYRSHGLSSGARVSHSATNRRSRHNQQWARRSRSRVRY